MFCSVLLASLLLIIAAAGGGVISFLVFLPQTSEAAEAERIAMCAGGAVDVLVLGSSVARGRNANPIDESGANARYQASCA